MDIYSDADLELAEMEADAEGAIALAEWLGEDEDEYTAAAVDAMVRRIATAKVLKYPIDDFDRGVRWMAFAIIRELGK